MEKEALEGSPCYTFTAFLSSPGSPFSAHVGQSPHLFFPLNKPQELAPISNKSSRTATEYLFICSM